MEIEFAPDVEARMEQLRSVIATGDPIGWRYSLRGSIFAALLWKDFDLKSTLAGRMSWRQFEGVYRDHRAPFTRWLFGESSFQKAFNEFLATVGTEL